MTDEVHKPGVDALQALLSMAFSALGEKEYAAAAGLLAKKLMISAGQTLDDMKALRDAVGHDIFDAQLKSLTAHQARLLARRLDKSVPDLEVSTAGAACAWIRGLMDGAASAAEPATETETAPETEIAAETPAEPAAPAEAVPEPAEAEAPKPAASKAYFGRKSFRTGD